jgi:hypothetical protein
MIFSKHCPLPRSEIFDVGLQEVLVVNVDLQVDEVSGLAQSLVRL